MNFIYPLIAVLIWSVNSIVSKLAASSIDPAAISFYRWFIAFLVISPFAISSVIRQRKIIKQYLLKFFVLGALGMCMFQGLAYYAAQTISAALMGVANGVIPLLTLILSLFILRTTITLGLIIGGMLSFIGLVWLVTNGHPLALFSNGINKGELLILLASLAYALYGVLLKKWAIPVTAWASLYIQIFFGLLCILPLFLSVDNVALTGQNIPLVLFAGIPASIIAPFTWMAGIRLLGAYKASIFLNFAPIFTLIIAAIFLDESITIHFTIGTVLVLIGVFIAQTLKKTITNKRKNTAPKTGS
ncbi:DMT family transporter [Orbus sturtevantii]|uniref:DMT family transporter n=1 Tax=Orbus sturtevantii TaxID=3074109 RepID=UPI00370D54A0